jgi:DNA (cytosine-5)-methyltransferase 1
VSSYAQSLRNGHEVVLNHHTKRLEELRQKRLSALAEGQNRADLPEHLSAGGHETKYRRLKSSAASPTVTAHMGKDLSDFIHPTLPRTLTVREAARIQGFPDSYEFLGSQASQFTQVGNAVPVHLAYELGQRLSESLSVPKRAKRRSPSPRVP